jgi:ammonia channel protein AmtB
MNFPPRQLGRFFIAALVVCTMALNVRAQAPASPAPTQEQRIAANAFTTTTLATAVGAFTWGLIELTLRKQASILGFCSGAVAGLVVITPACGFVNSTGAVLIGVFAAMVPYFFVNKVKAMFGYDDALDTFGVHAIGGTIGVFLTGILAVPATLADGTANPGAVNPNLAANVDIFIHHAHSGSNSSRPSALPSSWPWVPLCVSPTS